MFWEHHRGAGGNLRRGGNGIPRIHNAAIVPCSTTQPFNDSIISGKQDPFFVLRHHEAPEKKDFLPNFYF
jgi:hypothetical protein